jgi:hypothetical protein
VAAAAALADLVLVLATVIGAVLGIGRDLATARRVCALLMLFDLHGDFPDGRAEVMHLPG